MDVHVFEACLVTSNQWRYDISDSPVCNQYVPDTWELGLTTSCMSTVLHRVPLEKAIFIGCAAVASASRLFR